MIRTSLAICRAQREICLFSVGMGMLLVSTMAVRRSSLCIGLCNTGLQRSRRPLLRYRRGPPWLAAHIDEEGWAPLQELARWLGTGMDGLVTLAGLSHGRHGPRFELCGGRGGSTHLRAPLSVDFYPTRRGGGDRRHPSGRG